MFPRPSDFVEMHRIRGGPMASDASYGNNGAFLITSPFRSTLKVIVSDGEGWEHVSVSVNRQARCPTWDEMCWVKDLFWDAEEVVVQYHPRKSEYVKCHPFALHLWKPIGVDMPRPPAMLVGIPQ